MKAEIIAVGTEILLGEIVNTNAQYISAELASLGIEVYYQSVVGDNPERLENTIFTSFEHSDLVITTGGLGPTVDDLTKETGAKYFGKELVLDERALGRIEKFFARMGRVMTDNNKKQAYVPEGSIVLYNDNGTAPGIIIEDNGKILIMLPGPPREVYPMFEKYIRPYLEKKQEYTFVSRVLKVAEVGESTMETLVRDIIDAQTNPTIAPYAKPTGSLLRITAKAKSEEAANRMIDPVAKSIYERLGESIYAENETTMEEVIVKLLTEKNMTIAIAESCTGGMVASELISVPGVSKVLKEALVTYSNESKMSRLGVKKETLEKYGAVSPETAYEMAEGVAKTAGTDVGLSVTGIAGPDGGTEEKPVGLVYFGIYINGETKTKETRVVGKRQRIRERSMYSALNWLRLELIKTGK
ncbi:MAG: competence/damage-inducible protein A [Lachnospiraceae bacterium]|nr:competence/damage-inducible protein A [Lachnospiraceae bacterium]